MYPINLDSFVVSSVKLHSLGSCRKKRCLRSDLEGVLLMFLPFRNMLVSLLCVYMEEENCFRQGLPLPCPLYYLLPTGKRRAN